jgi:hypothetical protein
MLSNSGEKFAAGNAFVSGDWRSSRWCTVEVSSHRLGVQVCDGSYIAFVMKKVNGPAQAKLGLLVARVQITTYILHVLGSFPPSLGLFERTKSTRRVWSRHGYLISPCCCKHLLRENPLRQLSEPELFSFRSRQQNVFD